MKETEGQLRERLTNIMNKHLNWRTRLRFFFFPMRKKLCINLLVNSAKYIKCHKYEIESVKFSKDVLSNTEDLTFAIDVLVKTLPSYTFIKEEKASECKK